MEAGDSSENYYILNYLAVSGHRLFVVFINKLENCIHTLTVLVHSPFYMDLE
jgi:uncharacterized protein YpiB (UPF0302 family)